MYIYFKLYVYYIYIYMYIYILYIYIYIYVQSQVESYQRFKKCFVACKVRIKGKWSIQGKE